MEALHSAGFRDKEKGEDLKAAGKNTPTYQALPAKETQASERKALRSADLTVGVGPEEREGTNTPTYQCTHSKSTSIVPNLASPAKLGRES